MENSTFFEHGFVKLVANDYLTRMVSIDVCMPCTLFQAITPQLLGTGYVDHFRIRSPIAVWIPKLTDERYKPSVRHQGISDRLHVALREEILKTCKLFEHISDYLEDPSDIIPILPLGVYVEFSFRCHIDQIIGMLEGINNIRVAGIPEFQWSLASVLKESLEDFSKIFSPKLHSKC